MQTVAAAVDASATTRNVLGAATGCASLLDAGGARVHVAGRTYCPSGEVALALGARGQVLFHVARCCRTAPSRHPSMTARPTHRWRWRWVPVPTRLLVVCAATAASAAAVGAVSRREAVREELRRLRRFLRPLPKPVPQPPVPPALPTGTVIDLRGRGEVFVRDSGPPAEATGADQVPPVLLLHGWTVTADINFYAAYGPLAERYRVLAMDHRGHGRGMRSTEDFSLEDCADDAAALLRELGIDHAIVVGYSMGGPIAMLLAHRHPKVVVGLVVQATAPEWRTSARERRVWRALPVLDAALRLGTGEGFVVRFLRQVVEEQPDFQAFEPWLTGEFRRGYIPDIVGAGRALSRYDARPFAASLGVAAVSVVTTRDRLVPPFKQRQLAAALDALVMELEADHDAPVSCSAAYAKVTREAVDAVAERRRA